MPSDDRLFAEHDDRHQDQLDHRHHASASKHHAPVAMEYLHQPGNNNVEQEGAERKHTVADADNRALFLRREPAPNQRRHTGMQRRCRNLLENVKSREFANVVGEEGDQ